MDMMTPLVQDLFEIGDQDSLGLHHLTVQQRGGGRGPPPKSRDDVRAEDDKYGPKRRKRGYDKKMSCKGTRDVSAECINAYYYWLSENNEWEWVMALKRWFWTKAWLAIFGPVLVPLAFSMGWIILLFPGAKPDIDDLPSWRDKPITSAWYLLVASTAMTVEPTLFMLTQLFTWGESDLRDFAIIYMDNVEAFIYFMVTTVWMISDYVPSTIWLGVTWWIYGLIISVKVFAYVLDDDGIKGHGGRREYSSGGRGGRAGWKGKGGDDAKTPPTNPGLKKTDETPTI